MKSAAQRELDELRAEVLSLRADKERLDWLDNPSFVDGGDSGRGYWSWEATQGVGNDKPRYWTPSIHDSPPSLRSAIDASRQLNP
jgi:hypothetical protein